MRKVKSLQLSPNLVKPPTPGGRETVPVTPFVPGNNLFDRATFAIGLDGQTTRHLLEDVCTAAGTTPMTLEITHLEAGLPEVRRRLAELVPEEVEKQCMSRLRKLLASYED